MRFKGKKPRARAASEKEWSRWSEAFPDLVAFAEYWAELMEKRLQKQGGQVRCIVESTLDETRVSVASLGRAQVREVVLGLGRSWYLGLALCNWAKEYGYLEREA